MQAIQMVGGVQNSLGSGPAAATGEKPQGDSADPQTAFVRTVVADTEDVWGKLFTAQNASSQQPTMVLYTGSTPTAGGAGQAAKICNNMILGATMIATCEAFALAEKLGLDLQTFYDISRKASGQSWSMTSYCPVPGVGPASPADNSYQGGFAAALMLKDLRLAMEAARSAGSQVPMGARAEELYAAFNAAGNGGQDFSAIIKTL